MKKLIKTILSLVIIIMIINLSGCSVDGDPSAMDCEGIWEGTNQPTAWGNRDILVTIENTTWECDLYDSFGGEVLLEWSAKGTFSERLEQNKDNILFQTERYDGENWESFTAVLKFVYVLSDNNSIMNMSVSNYDNPEIYDDEYVLNKSN